MLSARAIHSISLKLCCVTEPAGRVCHDATPAHCDSRERNTAGLENGDLADTTEYSANYRRAYRGQLIIYAADNEATSADTPLDRDRARGFHTNRAHHGLISLQFFIPPCPPCRAQRFPAPAQPVSKRDGSPVSRRPARNK